MGDNLTALGGGQDQVEARRTAVDPRTLSDPSTGWDQRKRRTGLVAIKVGMTSEYSEYMEWLPLTVLQVRPPPTPRRARAM